MANIIGISGKAGSGKDTVANYLVERHGFVKMSLADEMKRFAKKVFGFSDQQLWGPSHCRNEVDHAYDDIERWDLAFDNLETYGVEWCRFLFNDGTAEGGVRAIGAFVALCDWFDSLQVAYGPLPGRANTLSPRVVLQTIGTEWGRAQDPQVWVRGTMKVANQVLSSMYSYTRENGCTSRLQSLSGPTLASPAIAIPASGPPYLMPVPGVVIPDVRFENEVVGVRDGGGQNWRVTRPGAKLVDVGIAGHASEAEMDRIPDTAFNWPIESPEGLDNLYAFLAAFVPLHLTPIHIESLA